MKKKNDIANFFDLDFDLVLGPHPAPPLLPIPLIESASPPPGYDAEPRSCLTLTWHPVLEQSVGYGGEGKHVAYRSEWGVGEWKGE